ncbi:Ycf54 domain-containing protein [Cephalotus follicularis]|uniref:Ycf54 domain-containing protein n=1 Tax=Cephalotus follicularis TaxID=3775 RepID=A0A1Q3CL05_CEPFO|nr:Ycf54 domain-containing protein [Cephalotus follicularis]
MSGPACLTLGSSVMVGVLPINNQHCTWSSKALPVFTNSHSKGKGFSSTTSRHTSSFKTAVAAVDSTQLSPPNPPADQQQPNKYYFVVANAKFMLDEEEHFQELLFEKRRNYAERNREQDFWLVIEPKFLDKFPNITKRLRRPAVALVSTNGLWITFMKLRLDRVLSDTYEAESPEEALASNPTNLEFEKPEKWVAPYPKYESNWWEPFLPTGSKEFMEV